MSYEKFKTKSGKTFYVFDKDVKPLDAILIIAKEKKVKVSNLETLKVWTKESELFLEKYGDERLAVRRK